MIRRSVQILDKHFKSFEIPVKSFILYLNYYKKSGLIFCRGKLDKQLIINHEAISYTRCHEQSRVSCLGMCRKHLRSAYMSERKSTYSCQYIYMYMYIYKQSNDWRNFASLVTFACKLTPRAHTVCNPG